MRRQKVFVRAELGAGDATVEDGTPGSTERLYELSSLDPGALTEATEASAFCARLSVPLELSQRL